MKILGVELGGLSAIGTFTRDMSASPADVSYTISPAFKPDLLILSGIHQGEKGMSQVYWNATTAYGIQQNSAGLWWFSGVLEIYTAAGGRCYGQLKSMDNSGFTITWNKTNSPTGSFIISYIALKLS